MNTDATFLSYLISTYGAKLVVIILLLLFGKIVFSFVVSRLLKIASRHSDKKDEALEKRARTLGGVLQATGNVVIYAIILIMILDLFGVDIRPVLAGVGIVGLAIGFGAQSVVKDFVSGLFILVENQYSVGDKVQIGAVSGEVLQITIRSTIIRSDEGNTVYISNGIIGGKEVINLSQRNSA